MATKERVEDFGEHIGGARKELFAAIKRGGLTWELFVENSAELDDVDLEAVVKLSNIWQSSLEDMQEAYKNGAALEHIWLYRYVYTSIQSKVKKCKDYKFVCEKYIELVLLLKSELDALLKKPYDSAVLKDWLMGFLSRNGYVSCGRATRDGATAIFAVFGSVGYKKLVRSSVFKDLSIKASIEMQGLPETEDKRFMGVIAQADKGSTWDSKTGKNLPYRRYSIYTAKPIKFMGRNISSNYKIVGKEWKGEEEVAEFTELEKQGKLNSAMSLKEYCYAGRIAENGVKKAVNDIGEKAAKPKDIVRPQLAHISRTGVDIRKGKQVTGKDILNTFGLRAGEFGEYETQKDRLACLNYSYDAFYDLAYATGLAPESIGLGYTEGVRKLAIAFGARGRSGALAHYEPVKHVINLTKMKGAGCLAHEWGHALDFALNNIYGGTTDTTRSFSSLVNQFLFYGDRIFADKSEEKIAIMLAMQSVVIGMQFKVDTTKENDRATTQYKYLIDKYNIPCYAYTGRSEYYTSARKRDKYFGKSKLYYQELTELFARAFETYVEDKLPYKSQYLVHNTQNDSFSKKEGICVYPDGVEKEYLAQCFDALFRVLRDVFAVNEFKSDLDFTQVSATDLYIQEAEKSNSKAKKSTIAKLRDDLPRDFVIQGSTIVEYTGKGKNSIRITEGVTQIQKGVFFGKAEGITDIYLPLSLKDAGTLIEDCEALEHIAIAPENSTYTVQEDVLFNKGGTELIGYPKGKKTKVYEIPEGVTTIGTKAFASTKVMTVRFAGTVKSIKPYAFEKCMQLQSVQINEGCTAIQPYIFSGCQSLTSVKLPDSLRCINKGMFGGCTSLEHIDLPKQLEAIGSGAFNRCVALKSIKLPASVTTLGELAFGLCSELQTINTENVLHFDTASLSHCISLKSVTLSKDVNNMGKNVFSGLEDGFVIKGYTNSLAEDYAKEYSIKFQALDEVKEKELVEDYVQAKGKKADKGVVSKSETKETKKKSGKNTKSTVKAVERPVTPSIENEDNLTNNSEKSVIEDENKPTNELIIKQQIKDLLVGTFVEQKQKSLVLSKMTSDGACVLVDKPIRLIQGIYNKAVNQVYDKIVSEIGGTFDSLYIQTAEQDGKPIAALVPENCEAFVLSCN